MMKRLMGMVLVAGGILITPAIADGQVGRTIQERCREGVPQGDLGISGLDCRGECTLTMNEKGEEQAWSFTVEPRINGLSSNGPAEGLLRVGDILVAIDGVPITTRDGGARYANVEPGQEVDLLVRRGGERRRVTVRAGSVCPPPPPRPLSPAPLLPRAGTEVADTVPPPPPSRTVIVGRMAPPPPPDTVVTARRSLGVAVSPRVRVAPDRRAVAVVEGVEGVSTVAVRARTSLGLLAGNSPTGRLGIGFQCKECGTRTDEESNQDIWFFSGPLEVTAVNSGGPADVAGIKRGDFIKAIDGQAIDTDEGGLAFTRITPGERIRLTVVKRNGSDVEVSLLPEDAMDSAVARGRGRTVVPARVGVEVSPGAVRRPTRVDPAPPPAPERVVVPVPVAVAGPPEGMPLRYSGTVEGVEVEVRGEPVTVSEVSGTRTLYINADGLWIRITVPRRTVIRGGGTTGVGDVIRR